MLVRRLYVAVERDVSGLLRLSRCHYTRPFLRVLFTQRTSIWYLDEQHFVDPWLAHEN